MRSRHDHMHPHPQGLDLPLHTWQILNPLNSHVHWAYDS